MGDNDHWSGCGIPYVHDYLIRLLATCLWNLVFTAMLRLYVFGTVSDVIIDVGQFVCV